MSIKLPSLADREDYDYINAVSQTILSRGYLEEGFDKADIKGAAIKRVNFLVDHAEKILGFELPTMRLGVRRGWVSPSSPVWSNFGTDRGLPISCVTGDAWINTRQGAKLAKDVEIGDELLTHKNRFRKVTAVIPTENRGDIYSLKVVGRLTRSHFTGNHEILTNEGWLRVDQLDPARHLVAINNGAEWIETNHVIDMTGFVPYDHAVESGRIVKKLTAKNSRLAGRTNVAHYAEPNASVEVSSDLAWALGLWFAEGSITRSKTGPNGIRITLSIKEEEIGKRWLEIISNAFGVNGSISYGGRKSERTWLNVNVNSVVLGRFFQSFGNGCKEKQMPQWLMELPRTHLAEVLDGIIEGDGSRRKSSGTWKITLANPHLIMQAYLLALRCGVNVSLQMQDKPSHWGKTKFVYTIVSMKDRGREISRFTPNSGVSFHDGLVYTPIREMVKTDRVETVYDFTVDEDHSFSVAGMVVHNCNGSFIDDTVDSIVWKVAEIGMMTKEGAGTSAYMGKLRASGSHITGGGKSNGPVHFARLVQEQVNVISQSNVRRGNAAIYLDVDHPDIGEWMQMRSTVNEIHHPIQHLSFGVCISDEWMNEMLAEEKGGAKRKLITAIVNKRRATGYPYIFFTGNVNKHKPAILKELGIDICASNLCTEIALPSSPDESFVCCLISANLLYFDEWKDTAFIREMTYFLDAVMSEYIEKLKQPGRRLLADALKFAERWRALGLGTLGYHSYLQQNMITFMSQEAREANIRMHKYISDESKAASEFLARIFGEPEGMIGTGLRNLTLQAIAPTRSSSLILGQVSKGIEPWDANIYEDDNAKSTFVHKNKSLEALLSLKGMNTPKVWDSILMAAGSVQHLSGLDEREKAVFKTFLEIGPDEIIQQAADRQVYVDQAQSINLKIHPDTPLRENVRYIIDAWKKGVKSLYYHKGLNRAQEVALTAADCTACEA